MAIIVKTNGLDERSPLNVLISEGIGDGSIVTWDYDEQGDFTHVTPDRQWVERAIIHPYQTEEQKARGEIVFGCLFLRNEDDFQKVYAVQMGRFAEMLLAHFSDVIDEL